MSLPLADTDLSWVFIELGAIAVGLAWLARLAHRLGFSAIPLYLLAGLAFGNGGLVPLRFSTDLVHVGSEIGVLLLLFMLGLETTGSQLATNLRGALPAGIVDFALNFVPGALAGWVLGFGLLPSVLLGGVTYISSSGITAKLIAELGWQRHPETPTILSLLVLEDLTMAVFLPLVTVLLIGQDARTAAISVAIALAAVALVLLVATRFGEAMSRRMFHSSDEVLLLSILGLILVAAGVAQRLQVSAAVGAFLAGIALSGPVVRQAHRLLAPLRDLFAAIFFLFFGLQIDPATLAPVLGPAAVLGVVTAATKLATGWWAARRAGVSVRGRWRAGAALVGRGEFSFVIAGLGVGAGLEPRLGPLSAAYVLLMAVLGPVIARGLTPRGRPPASGAAGA